MSWHIPYCPEQVPMGTHSSSTNMWGWVAAQRYLKGSTIIFNDPRASTHLGFKVNCQGLPIYPRHCFPTYLQQLRWKALQNEWSLHTREIWGHARLVVKTNSSYDESNDCRFTYLAMCTWTSRKLGEYNLPCHAPTHLPSLPPSHSATTVFQTVTIPFYQHSLLQLHFLWVEYSVEQQKLPWQWQFICRILTTIFLFGRWMNFLLQSRHFHWGSNVI